MASAGACPTASPSPGCRSSPGAPTRPRSSRWCGSRSCTRSATTSGSPMAVYASWVTASRYVSAVAFPKKLLNDGEEVVLDLRPHWIYMAEPTLALVGTLGVGVGVWKIGNSVLSGLWALLLIFCLGWFGIRYAKWSNPNFGVTTDRVI